MANTKPEPLKDQSIGNLQNARIVAGNIATGPAPGIKTDGIKIRGTGVATKGKVARGPMG